MEHQAGLEFKNQILCSRSKSQKERPFLIFLNPALLHSLQYFSNPTAFLPPIGFDRSTAPGVPIDDTLLSLLAAVEDIEQQTHAELADFQFDRAILAMQDMSKGRKGEILVHQMIRVKALEALVWSTTMNVSVPFQVPTTLEEIKTGRQVEIGGKYGEIGRSDWHKTIQEFTTLFLRRDLDVSPSRNLELKGDKISSSLFSLLKQAGGEKHHSTVISNIVCAALGLRALMEVR